MPFRPVFSLVFALSILWSVGLGAKTETSQKTDQKAANFFREGVSAFQKGDDNSARAAFHSALQIDELNPYVLYNLALTESRSNHFGLALALLRKALALRSGFTSAEHAIQWIRGKLEHGDIPHEVEYWESFRSAALVTTPLQNYLLLDALFLLSSGWMMLRHFGRRRQARLDEKPMPIFPFAGAACMTLLFISTGISFAKAYDQSEVRGTIIVKKTAVRSSPDTQGTPLFDLYEGLEAIVRQRTGEWIQITYPGGSTGWIPANTILTTADKIP